MYWTTPSGTRYQTGMPAADPVPAVGGADRQRGHLDQAHRALGQVGVGAGGSPGRVTPTKWASSNSCSLSRQLTIWARASAPVMKNSSASGRWRRRSVQRVDRVRRAAAVDVDPADREPRVGRGGDDRHQVAVLGRADLALGLLPRLAGRHEHDLVEAEQPGDLAGGDEVAVVDGVERPAHDPDPAARHPTEPIRARRSRSAEDRLRPADGGRRPEPAPDRITHDRLPRAAGRRPVRVLDARMRTGAGVRGSRGSAPR